VFVLFATQQSLYNFRIRTITNIPTTTIPTIIPRFRLKMLNLKLLEDFLAVGRQEGCDVAGDVSDDVTDEVRSMLGVVVARPVGRLVVSE
jgi:hypothetical protein